MPFIGQKSLIMAWLTAFGKYLIFHHATACLTESSNTTYARGHSCYEFNVEEKTWMQAQDYCHDRGGLLVSIAGADVQAWLSSTADRLWPHKNSVWIGLNSWSMGERFVWDSFGTSEDHAIAYSNWAEGYPSSSLINGKCVLMHRSSGWRWTTDTCWGPYSHQFSFVCEYGNTDAAEAETTSAPNANMDLLATSFSGGTDSQLIVLHAGVLYLAVAAAAVVVVIIVVYIGVAYKKSLGSQPTMVAAV